MLFQMIASESGVVKRDCLKMVYFIMHKNLVTMKLLSQRFSSQFSSYCVVSYLQLIMSNILINSLLSVQQQEFQIIDFSVYSTILDKNEDPSSETPFSIQLDIIRYSILVSPFKEFHSVDDRRTNRSLYDRWISSG